jgi:hypothetical protein
MLRLLYVFPFVLALVLNSTVTAVATAGSDQSKVPPDLRVPDGYVRVLHSVGRGVQIYDCVNAAWKLRGPAATIFDESSDDAVAIHYVGPTWQSTWDGSTVAATVKTPRDAPNPQRDIPWLLLQATSNVGPGLFADVQYIQRLDTNGGVAPSGSCTTGRSVGVPYKTTYDFWAPAK